MGSGTAGRKVKMAAVLAACLRACTQRPAVAVAVVVFAAAARAGAAEAIWTGAANVTWSDGANWDTGAAPGAEDTAVFADPAAPNDPRVTATATVGAMRLETPRQTFRVSTKCQLKVSGPVTGSGGIRMTGDNTGTWGDNGRLELHSVSNSFEGGVEITAGTVRFGNVAFPLGTSLGTGDILVNGGTFSFLPSEASVNTSGAPQTPGTRSFSNLLKVGDSGGRAHQNVGSGADNMAVVYGDIELGGPLTLASQGGGKSYGYTIDGTITVLQDTSRSPGLSNETGHNGTDYVSGTIVDGAGGAGNALRLGATARPLNMTGLGNTYAGGTILGGSGGASVVFRPCTTLGTGNVMAETGARTSIRNLTPLGQPGALSASATIHARSGAAVGSGCGQASVSGTRTTGSPVITFSGMDSTVDLFVGQAVSGTGIPADAVIASIDSHTQITLSDNATSDGTSTCTFAARTLDVSSRFTATSSGIYAMEETHAYDLDQSALGNGEMFVGTVLGGTYAGRLSPGADNAYRVGGGEVSDILYTSGGNPLTITADDAFSGDARVIVGPGSEAGGAYRGFVAVTGNNSHSGGTVVNAGAALVLGKTGGTPTGTGPVVVRNGGIFGAAGANGTFFDGTVQFTNYALLPGATLLLSEYMPGNYSGSNGGQGRWGDASAMELADNTLYFHRGKNNTAYETIGALRFADQVLLRAADGGGTSRYMMTADELVRVEGGVFTSCQTLGDGQRLRTATGNEPAVVNGIVAPYLLDGVGHNFMTYDATTDSLGTVGLKPLATYVALTSAVPNDVATTGATTLGADVNVYALKITGGVKGTGKTITLGSGGFISTTYDQTIEPDFDFSAAEAIMYENDSRGITLAGAVTAPHGFVKCGGGSIKLAGANAIEGRIFVAQGTLRLENATAAADWADCVLSVSKFGTANLNSQSVSVAGLAGAGTVANGTLTVTQTFAPGGSLHPSRIDTAGLVLGPACTTTVELGTIGDEVAVAGDLTLDGTLDVVAAEGFAPGTYTIMTYSGTLTDNGMAIGSKPADAHVTLDTSEAGVVKLVVAEQMGATLFIVR
jgi:fibronectin-binding autotransporter adhesin